MFIIYHAINLILHVDSNAAYLVAPQVKSRMAGHLSFPQHHNNKQELNHAILIECKYLRHVVASAAEAEAGRLFHNTQTTIPLRLFLHHLRHPQPLTPTKTYNTIAFNFVHDNIH